jgi:RNA recognition motif-containing protein
VGSLATNSISRDDIIQMFQTYGTVIGVSVFQGYAFIQYQQPNEADMSVSALNGYNWNGSLLGLLNSLY